MGRLRRFDDDASWPLRTRNILGRSRACTLRLDGPQISGEHAVLRWTGSDWQVQDLHSRNGVFVDGRRLRQDERASVTAGARIGLGAAVFTLADDAPPAAFATREGRDGESVFAVGGVLTLAAPGRDVMVLRGAEGWSLEDAEEVRAVVDDEVVRVGADHWRLCLPEPLAATADARGDAQDLDLTLRFAVSRDEEHVELTAFHGARSIQFKPRAHHYLLLLLARLRLGQLRLIPAPEGWVDQQELLRMLQVDRNQLHLEIFRLRRQFADAGIEGAPRIVERRVGTRKLRIGTGHLEIFPLD